MDIKQVTFGKELDFRNDWFIDFGELGKHSWMDFLPKKHSTTPLKVAEDEQVEYFHRMECNQGLLDIRDHYKMM